MAAGGKQAGSRERGPRAVIALIISLAALAYATGVVVVASRAPDKGFLAFTGRRVVDVTAGSDVDRAGVEPGDRVVAIDGEPIRSTADYVDRLLRRHPGERIALEVERSESGQRLRVPVLLRRSAPPWPAVAASILAGVLAVLGLVARYSRPGDLAARRFWRTSVVYSIVYAGALSWPHLLVHPALAVVFIAALFLAAPLAMDFALIFPAPPRRRVTRWRLAAWIPATLMLAGVLGSAAWAVSDFRAGIASDRALDWVVRFISALLIFVVVVAAAGLLAQYQRARKATGAQRAQMRWLMFGFTLSALPTFIAIPVALADIERFLLYRYRPFVVAVAILWFTANSLSVLRIRLADVEAVIHRSVVYALASGAAVLIYLGLALGMGAVAEHLVGADSLVPQIAAAASAAALFGPLRTRVTHWLDKRFFRDRVHYLQALRELAETSTRLQEPPDLARAVVDGAVSALRASSGALYLVTEPSGDDGDRQLRLAHGTGDEFPGQRSEQELRDAAGDGIALPIARGDERAGVLLFGPRLDGELYSSEDRDLLAALAGQLSVAFENAKAFGTIAEMTRTLEAQNQEIRELRDRLEDENLYLKGRLESAAQAEQLVGSSKAVRELLKQLESVAATHANVLLLGESGTGKGLVARTLHAASERADGPFIQVDCGAIPHGVFESELFGHERGAFTGAVRKRRGHFELADGGTLFLDEIGELPLDLQPKLLRALQERRFLRVGGAEPVTVDARIIAATNRNLEEMVARGAFREDLYFRLRVVELTAPPLRARKGDLPALVEHMLPRLCRRNHRPLPTLTDEAVERLKAYGWPGNVRELENVLERAVVLCDHRRIDADDLALPDRPPGPPELFAALDLDGDESHDQVMEAIERQRLVAAMRAAGGNQSSAARSLGMARTTLINKLRRYGLL